MSDDKPAATGSGEPRREGHSALRVNNGKLETFDPHPTPPASQPTVTLDRETVRALLEIAPHFPPSTRYGKAYADALALLRAAEGEQEKSGV